MKRLSSLSTSVLTALLVIPFAAVTAIADDGTWNTISSGNWSDSTKWSDNTIADGAGSTAIFSAPAPNTSSPVVTIALDSDRTIGNLTFSGTADTGTHNFQLDGPGTLTLSAGATPTIANSLASRNAAINVILTGSQGVSYITSGGASSTSIGGANTYTGLTQIAGGGVTATHNLAFGSTTGGTAIADGEGYVKLADGVTITGETLHAQGNGGKSNFGVLHTDTNAVAEWAGNIVLDSTSVRIGANGGSSILTLSGVISDSDATARNVSFSHGNDESANGTIVLSGANTYGGSTTVYRGILKLDAGNNRLPTGTTLSIGGTATDATVDLNGYDQTVADLTTGAKTSTRTLTNTSGTTSTFTVNKASGSSTFAGVISGAINVTKAGNGTLNLTGTDNAFTGNISVDAGTLSLASAFIDDNADVILLTGAVLNLNYTGTDSIGRLFIDGLVQDTGTYGAIGSGAQNQSAFFTGAGLLNVTSAVIPEPTTTAALTGLAALSLVALRRRHR